MYQHQQILRSSLVWHIIDVQQRLISILKQRSSRVSKQTHILVCLRGLLLSSLSSYDHVFMTVIGQRLSPSSTFILWFEIRFPLAFVWLIPHVTCACLPCRYPLTSYNFNFQNQVDQLYNTDLPKSIKRKGH